MPHQTLTFVHPQSPQQVVASKLIIQQKLHWADAWSTLPNATLDFANWAVSPSVGRAQITYRYGFGKQPTSNVFAPIAFIDLSRRYIRICLEFASGVVGGFWESWGGEAITTSGGEGFEFWSGSNVGACWIGQCEVMAKLYHGTLDTPSGAVPSGEVTIMAYGLEHLMEQHRIETAEWIGDDGTTIEISKAGFIFNDKISDTFNLQGRGNRSENKPPGFDYYVFDDSEDSKAWSSRDIIEYLIKSFTGTPLDDNGNPTIYWKVSDIDLDLIPNWDKPQVETHLVTVKQILDALINRRRLLTWWAEVDENDSNKVALKVASFTDAPISLPFNSAEIPANTFTVDLDFDEDMTAEIVQQIDNSHEADQVIAYGARRRNVFTARFGITGSIDMLPGWTGTQETAYQDGGSSDPGYPAAGEITERRYWHASARSREEVKDVFKRYVLFRQNYPKDDPDSYKNFFPNVRIQKTMPLYKGINYEGSAIVGGAIAYPDFSRFEEREPLVIIKVPGTEDKYVDITLLGRSGKNEVATEVDVRDWSANVRVTQDTQAISIDVVGAPQHTIAHGPAGPGTFDGLAEDEDEHGQWNWRDMLATFAISDERFAEGRYPLDADLPSVDAKRLIRVPAGDQYKLDWVHANTVVDIDRNGQVIETGAAGYLNDHRNDLNDIAKSAYTWYSKTRHALRVRTDWQPPAQNLHIGQYCTFMLVNDVPTPVGALITQLELQAYSFTGEEPRPDLPAVKLTITTAFGELDFLHLRSGVTQRKKTPVRKPKR